MAAAPGSRDAPPAEAARAPTHSGPLLRPFLPPARRGSTFLLSISPARAAARSVYSQAGRGGTGRGELRDGPAPPRAGLGLPGPSAPRWKPFPARGGPGTSPGRREAQFWGNRMGAVRCIEGGGAHYLKRAEVTLARRRESKLGRAETVVLPRHLHLPGPHLQPDLDPGGTQQPTRAASGVASVRKERPAGVEALEKPSSLTQTCRPCEGSSRTQVLSAPSVG